MRSERNFLSKLSLISWCLIIYQRATVAFYACPFSKSSSSANFLVPNVHTVKSTELTVLNRRETIEKTIGSVLILVATPTKSNAKDKEPVTPELLANAFVTVKKELQGNEGGIIELTKLIDEQKWEDVKQFTREYDIEFRKDIMGKARKMIPGSKNNDEIKSAALQYCNNVTFDLIAVNKASRVGDLAAAKKALGILIDDVNGFLDLENKVSWE